MLLQVVVWEIWRARNQVLHDSKPFNIQSIIYTCRRTTSLITGLKSFHKAESGSQCDILSSMGFQIAMIPSHPPRRVQWQPPMMGHLKLNTDGASKGNPGASGGGGVIRDHKGSVIFAFLHYYGVHHSLIAEMRALLDGLRYCSALSLAVTHVEVDSKLLVDILHGVSSCPWRLHYWIREAKLLLSQGNISVLHTLREGNMPADKLANEGCTTRNIYSRDHRGRPSRLIGKYDRGPFLGLGIRVVCSCEWD